MRNNNQKKHIKPYVSKKNELKVNISSSYSLELQLVSVENELKDTLTEYIVAQAITATEVANVRNSLRFLKTLPLKYPVKTLEALNTNVTSIKYILTSSYPRLKTLEDRHSKHNAYTAYY